MPVHVVLRDGVAPPQPVHELCLPEQMEQPALVRPAHSHCTQPLHTAIAHSPIAHSTAPIAIGTVDLLIILLICWLHLPRSARVVAGELAAPGVPRHAAVHHAVRVADIARRVVGRGVKDRAVERVRLEGRAGGRAGRRERGRVRDRRGRPDGGGVEDPEAVGPSAGLRAVAGAGLVALGCRGRPGRGRPGYAAANLLTPPPSLHAIETLTNECEGGCSRFLDTPGPPPRPPFRPVYCLEVARGRALHVFTWSGRPACARTCTRGWPRLPPTGTHRPDRAVRTARGRGERSRWGSARE